MLRRHGKAIGAQKRVVARYWRRMYGSRRGEYEARRIADLAESISRQLATEPGQCPAHADELMRRLEADWPALLRRIQYVPGEYLLSETAPAGCGTAGCPLDSRRLQGGEWVKQGDSATRTLRSFVGSRRITTILT